MTVWFLISSALAKEDSDKEASNAHITAEDLKSIPFNSSRLVCEPLRPLKGLPSQAHSGAQQGNL
ncbi:hypothetical protein [Leisingera sp. ANG-Vp]|uniref:hypothetical protein n=1 Tax=Leisingera sp. ANG-Vp TaxID=1577896 RepID=UPI00126A569D|nr:hypothetical protein [Leisingera sp. ANG-Vp]